MNHPNPPFRRTLRTFLVTVVVALAGGAAALLAGASTPGDHAATHDDRTVTSTSGARPAPIIHRPAGLPAGKKVPLLIALHSGHSNPAAFEGGTGLDRVADANGFVVAYLGTPTVPEWVSPSDITYISSMIDQLTRSQNIDPRRVYVTGFSIGGYATFRSGCDLASKVAGIAIVSTAMAPLWKKPCKLTRPVSELNIAGSNDEFPVHATPSSPISADQTAASWRTLDGCTSASSTSQVGPTTQTVWDTCNDGSRVAEYVVNGGGHAWPGAPGYTGADAAYNASQAVWAFLSRQVASSATAPGVRLVSLRRKGRVLHGALAVTEQGATARVRLRAKGHVVADRTFHVGMGASAQLAVRIPSAAGTAPLSVQLQFADGYGRHAALTRTVR